MPEFNLNLLPESLAKCQSGQVLTTHCTFVKKPYGFFKSKACFLLNLLLKGCTFGKVGVARTDSFAVADKLLKFVQKNPASFTVAQHPQNIKNIKELLSQVLNVTFDPVTGIVTSKTTKKHSNLPKIQKLFDKCLKNESQILSKNDNYLESLNTLKQFIVNGSKEDQVQEIEKSIEQVLAAPQMIVNQDDFKTIADALVHVKSTKLAESFLAVMLQTKLLPDIYISIVKSAVIHKNHEVFKTFFETAKQHFNDNHTKDLWNYTLFAKNTEIAKVLIENDYLTWEVQTSSGKKYTNTALIELMWKWETNPSELGDLMLAKRPDLLNINSNGLTPLLTAVSKSDNLESVKWILSKKPDLSLKYNNQTILELANDQVKDIGQKVHIDIRDALVAAGAS